MNESDTYPGMPAIKEHLTKISNSIKLLQNNKPILEKSDIASYISLLFTFICHLIESKSKQKMYEQVALCNLHDTLSDMNEYLDKKGNSRRLMFYYSGSSSFPPLFSKLKTRGDLVLTLCNPPKENYTF